MTPSGKVPSETQIRDHYRELAVDWSQAQGDPKAANKLFRAHHAYYKSIRDLPEGRSAISGLVHDIDSAVRLLAATHSLAWDRDGAIAALTELERGGSLYAIDAEYTLKSYREGKLNLDW